MREAGRCCMAMGQQAHRQGDLMVMWSEMPRSPGHVFYDRLQQVLVGAGFDGFVETTCKPFYAATLGAPSVPPGRYFRMHMVGYFEGIDSERGIEWRCSDSLSLREFLRLESRERVPDHSWLSKTRSRLPQEVHETVFGWVLALIAQQGLIKGERIGVDASTMEANAALRTIVRRDTGAGDTTTLSGTLATAEANLATIGHAPTPDDPAECIADKGYHSRAVLKTLDNGIWKTRIAEPQRKAFARWHGDAAARAAVYGNRIRLRSGIGQAAMRRRAELVERSFAHTLERGGMRRTWLRGRANVSKRYLIHVAGHNLGLLMRLLIGAGTPKEAAARSQAQLVVLLTPDAIIVGIVIAADDEGVFLVATAPPEPH